MLNYIKSIDKMDYSDIHIKEGSRLAIRQRGEIIKTDKKVVFEDILKFLEQVGKRDMLDNLKIKGRIRLFYRNWSYKI